MSRTVAASVSLAVLLLAGTHSPAQVNSTTLIFTSSRKHVTVPQGTTVTLKTVAAKVQGPANMLVVPPEHYLEATVEEKIDGGRCVVGDRVRLSLAYPVIFEVDGTMVRVPAHASILGHVLFTAARDRDHKLSRLAIVADWVQWGSNFVVLPAVVATVGAPEVPRLEALRALR